MKHFLLTLLAIISFSVSSWAQAAKHVILITIDGFRPDFYLDKSWGAVNLQYLMENGVHAKGVNGIFPTVTFPSHTTLVTGVKAAKHGIYYNDPFEPTGPTGRWYWHYNAIKSPTIYDAVRQAGLKSASVLWPVTAGAPIDYNIPDIWKVGSQPDRREETSKHATPAGLWQEIELNATGKLEANDFNMDKDYLVMDDNVARMAAYLIRKYRPNFTTVHLPVVDHAEGRDGEQVRRAVTGADRAIRNIIEAVDKAGIKNQTAIIVTGDHGFVDGHTAIQPNIWLAQAGLLKDIKKDEWQAQFQPAGGSAFLYLKDAKDKKTLNRVRQLLAALPESQQKLFKVIEGAELAKASADPNVALALAAAPGVTFGRASTGEIFRPNSGGNHGYFPNFPKIQTGFIGMGAGFKKGGFIQEMEMIDVAPIIARLLGLEFKSADGMTYPGLLVK
ncbi:alkaline phosphatase family protein [Adhaeribacter rhizoryzae]|uniref:Alkaline phosphatase family protein n=1 Tax=Adhaeribacter rhizoryzae TaxID=2607907 RepID=A0A5M6DIT3_9BACT|nr:ectonucleotide pyrophosphatase/phosphodiesterase [Adhaeribacter rhizoryzae]KAA5547488.1 alkaline phosphatase family protein [Adhaeribacter rhizoryzae]